jgi:hypothetical protein
VVQRVAARHEGGARWGADVLHVVLLEHDAVGGHGVDGGRADLATGAEADVGEAEVVDDDHHDVGLLLLGGRAEGGKQGQPQKTRHGGVCGVRVFGGLAQRL